jgi:hypothetical protein
MGRQGSGSQRLGLVGVWMLWLLYLALCTTSVGEAGQALRPDAVSKAGMSARRVCRHASGRKPACLALIKSRPGKGGCGF